MPGIPNYGLDYVDMSELNKIKREMYISQTSNFRNLTEKPLTDPTKGKADSDLMSIIEQIMLVTGSLETLTGALKIDRDSLSLEAFKVSDLANIKTTFKQNLANVSSITGRIERINRSLERLRPNFNFVRLKTMVDFKTKMDLAIEAFSEFSSTTEDIIDFLTEDGLLLSKGYEKVNNPQPPIPGQEGMPPITIPGYRAKVLDEDIQAKIRALKFEDDFDVLEPGLSQEEKDRYEVYYINTALRLLRMEDREPTQKEFDIDLNVAEREDDRSFRLLNALNNKVKQINEPFVKVLDGIFIAISDFLEIGTSLTQSFNENREQDVASNTASAVRPIITDNLNMEGGRLSHPSSREMAKYYESGSSRYM